MPIPAISPLPPAPQRADGQDVFNDKSDPFIAAMPPMVLELNAYIAALNAYAPTIDGAVIVSNQALIAAQTAIAAAAASGASAGIYQYGNPGDSIIVNSSRSGIGFASPDQMGDVKIAAKQPGALWVPANGSIRAQVSMPALFAALGLLNPNVALAWSGVTPSPAISGTVVDVSSNQNTGVVIAVLAGTTGAAMRSTDYGATWTALTIAALSGVTANCITCDGNGIWLIGTSVGLTRSTDDGVTWAAQSGWSGAVSRAAINANGVSVVTLVASSTSVWLSTTAGSGYNISFTGTAAVHSCVATDGKGVWIVAAGTQLRRSVDDGNTWSVVFTTASAATAIATDKQGSWLISGATASGGTYKSPDNGLTWNLIAMVTSAVTDIAYGSGMFVLARSVSPQIGYLSAAPDAVVMSFPATGVLASAARVTSSGKGVFNVAGTASTAMLRSAPSYGYDTSTQFKLPDVPVPSGLQAWIKAGLINFGRGATFTRGGIPSAAGINPRALAINGRGTMVAVGDSGLIRRSTDFGVTWSTVGAGLTASALYAVVTNSRGVFVATGDNGVCLRSADDGATFSVVNAGFPSLRFRNLRIGLNDVMLTSSTGGSTLRRSTDGGLTWSAVASVPTGQFELGTDGVGRWLAINMSSGVSYISNDNGATFATTTTFPLGGGSLLGLYIFSNGVSIATFISGAARRSPDMGVTWPDTLPFGSTSGQKYMVLGPPGFLVAFTQGSGNLQYSSDYGNNWTNSATDTAGVVVTVGAAAFASQTGFSAILANGTTYNAIVDTYL